MSMYENDREQNIYETGRTRPPKSRGGFIALLLIAVIFVGGIFSALSSLNVSPFTDDREEGDCLNFSLSAEGETAANETAERSAFICSTAGFSGEFLSALERELGQLPGGLFITQVDAGSDAEKSGICPGDILLQTNNTQITDWESLNNALCGNNTSVNITLLRDGKELSLELTLSEEKDQ